MNKCPLCVEEGERSRLYPGPGMTTAGAVPEPYYDENGRYHNHDPNHTTRSFRCSREHRFTASLVHSCKSCSYGHEDPIIELDYTVPLPPGGFRTIVFPTVSGIPVVRLRPPEGEKVYNGKIVKG